jgi:gluconate 2-dehydrogenase gamma chain
MKNGQAPSKPASRIISTSSWLALGARASAFTAAAPGSPAQRARAIQLPYTPAELFRTALDAINKELSHTPFAQMSPDDQDSYLKKLEAGGQDLGGIPSEVFFAHLWESTLEGFFSDPVYGGNCNMVSWRMIGTAYA